MPADTLSVAGKIAIVTGSGRENGIGAAIARALARNGASVAIHYVSEEVTPRAQALAQSIRDEHGVAVAVVQADVSTPEGANKIVAETLQQLGVDHIDILVNNAGTGKMIPLTEVDYETIQRQFGANVYGPIFVTQAAVGLGKMPRGGRIINIGSVASKMGPAGLAIYGATKAAQDSLTASWARQLGHSHGITVNTIAPGPVDTDLTRSNPGVVEPLTKMQRMETRPGTVEEIADVVLFIASEKARWITAKYLAVDAGILGTA
ncbi:putative short-chain dehydrogenase [Hypoxylon rubiginosum]|uniref:Short-chain dehydrogenase n=1 Tax=Hypoxylon rubiginosum TaxID=110542 RepID=A0ACB9YVD3_9PEZI|nr:putative short-chain dehydrogenase [Hypoxylon rubiginosum]